MESQATTMFQHFTIKESKELENLLANYFQPYNVKLQLHRFLVDWKSKHKKYKQYRKEDFCYDGFMYDIKSSSHSILYVFDYKYEDRQTMRRIWKMQNFISKHCFNTNITNNSTSYIVLNKTNSKCIDTKSYVKNFEKYILQEIAIIRPTMIICCGCYDTVSALFQKYSKSEILSAIKYTPLLEMLPLTLQVKDKLFQLHFEYVYFRKFGWNI